MAAFPTGPWAAMSEPSPLAADRGTVQAIAVLFGQERLPEFVGIRRPSPPMEDAVVTGGLIRSALVGAVRSIAVSVATEEGSGPRADDNFPPQSSLRDSSFL